VGIVFASPSHRLRRHDGTFTLATAAVSGGAMPIVGMFYGIVVYMYFLDNKRHPMPHVHAEY
jgi:hypothetical protein